MDAEALEEGLVPKAPVDVAGFPVGIGHAADRIERPVEGVGSAGDVGLGFGQFPLGGVHFGRDLVLLGFAAELFDEKHNE